MRRNKGIKDGGGARMASEKSIRVRVVEWTSRDHLMGPPEQTVSMNATGGLEAAVKAAYSAFPGTCQRVRLVTPAEVTLWDDGRWLFSHRDMYNTIRENDLVEVHLNGMRPPGPDTPSRQRVPDGAAPPGAGSLPGPGAPPPRGDGPLGARLVRELLARLPALG